MLLLAFYRKDPRARGETPGRVRTRCPLSGPWVILIDLEKMMAHMGPRACVLPRCNQKLATIDACEHVYMQCNRSRSTVPARTVLDHHRCTAQEDTQRERESFAFALLGPGRGSVDADSEAAADDAAEPGRGATVAGQWTPLLVLGNRASSSLVCTLCVCVRTSHASGDRLSCMQARVSGKYEKCSS